MISRNKREGYYAGYYRPSDSREKRRHRRWDAWSMSEFYPPRFGCIWKLLEKEGRI